MDDLLALRRSPLAHLADQLTATGGETTVRVREVPYLSSFEVRADPAGPAMARLGAALFGATWLGGPPRAGSWPDPGRAVGTGPRYALWCGPGWYLVVDEPGTALAETIDGALGNRMGDGRVADVSVVEVSASRTVLELTGPFAPDVLAHGCAIDLHPRAFGPGSCVQTNLAKAQVILHQTENFAPASAGAGPGALRVPSSLVAPLLSPDDTGTGPTYRVFVRASYADYLARWLLDAMVEYVGDPAAGGAA
jgi:sarcosine oxidase subunit gamma